MSEFKINRGQGKCSVTGRAFADGEKYFVALSADPEHEGVFSRVDICMEAWERQSPGAFIAFWPAEYSSKRKPTLMDPELLWEIFHRARQPQTDEKFTPDDLNRFAYVAALGLMRLKKLKLQGTRRAGKTEYLLFDTPGKGKDKQSYEVLNPALDEHGVMKVEERLSDLI
ncbi:MAG: hypothetical protein IT464_13695 [Planctomycetes bacterium]|nr:hypothetical protein [Planctomycetota bacterium]